MQMTLINMTEYSQHVNLVYQSAILAYLIYIIFTIVFKEYINTMNEKLKYQNKKHQFYEEIKKCQVVSTFRPLLLNKEEILEMLMYDDFPRELLIGGPNKTTNIQHNYQQAIDMIKK
jgi:hypothetical protein